MCRQQAYHITAHAAAATPHLANAACHSMSVDFCANSITVSGGCEAMESFYDFMDWRPSYAASWGRFEGAERQRAAAYRARE